MNCLIRCCCNPTFHSYHILLVFDLCLRLTILGLYYIIQWYISLNDQWSIHKVITIMKHRDLFYTLHQYIENINMYGWVLSFSILSFTISYHFNTFLNLIYFNLERLKIPCPPQATNIWPSNNKACCDEDFYYFVLKNGAEMFFIRMLIPQ